MGWRAGNVVVVVLMAHARNDIADTAAWAVACTSGYDTIDLS